MELNIGDKGETKIIHINCELSPTELKDWKIFFKENSSNFAWSYKDLKGIPCEVCEHHIHLDENIKPIR